MRFHERLRVFRSIPMRLVVLGLLCATVPVLPGCERTTVRTPAPPQVTVAQPVRRNVADHLDLTGNTQAVNTVQLRARVEGYLDKVYFQDGDMVKKDQALFLIQQDTYVARLQQAEGSVLAQKALLDQSDFGSQPNCMTLYPASVSAALMFEVVVDLPIPPLP